MSTPAPAVGQVWADNDARSAGRTLRIDALDDTHATCTVLTNSDDTQAALSAPPVAGYVPREMRGKTARVALTRLRPTSTGYRLVDADGAAYGFTAFSARLRGRFDVTTQVDYRCNHGDYTTGPHAPGSHLSKEAMRQHSQAKHGSDPQTEPGAPRD